MDGLVYFSKNVVQHGRAEEIVFNTWDSIFQENRITRDVDEEQLTSTVSLTIIEIVESGLIFKRTKEFERDTITLEYDYRTGRWSGDDNFKDKDGYGYYLGDTFEIWFNLYQTDFDNDFIPYWTEVNILGTDPRRDDSNKDPDGDKVSTFWEWKWGYDPFVWEDHEKLDPDMDGIENIEEFQTAKFFADPFAQDIYVEVDIMDGNGLLDRPRYFYEECQQAIIEKFAEHDIRLFFDAGWPGGPKNGGGDIVPYIEKLSGPSGMMLQFYNNYFPEERRGIFRYYVVGNKGGFNFPVKGNSPDTIYTAYNPWIPFRPLKGLINIIFYGTTPTIRGHRISIAAVAMHELGHTLGITPWSFEGCDNITYGFPHWPDKNYGWVDYRSVMNYQCIGDTKLLDYSHGTNGPPYDQNDWEMISLSYFQFNKELVPEPANRDFHDSNIFVWGENEVGVTGYEYDENLTQNFISLIGSYSPVDPIEVEWKVFRLIDKEDYPNLKEIKILVKTKYVPYSSWSEYAEGDLDSEDNFLFYSQQSIIDDVMSKISS
jgi:hypothetical protein